MEATPQTAPETAVQAGEALRVRRMFSTPGVHPFDTVEWQVRDAKIGFGDKVSFEQKDVEFPATWSQNATNIVAQKYFRGQLDSPARERSVKQMIGRVAGTIADWGRQRGYFATAEDGDTFEVEKAAHVRKDGADVTVSIKGKMIFIQNVALVYCTFRDITTRARLEEEARIAEARAAELRARAEQARSADGTR